MCTCIKWICRVLSHRKPSFLSVESGFAKSLKSIMCVVVSVQSSISVTLGGNFPLSANNGSELFVIQWILASSFTKYFWSSPFCLFFFPSNQGNETMTYFVVHINGGGGGLVLVWGFFFRSLHSKRAPCRKPLLYQTSLIRFMWFFFPYAG